MAHLCPLDELRLSMAEITVLSMEASNTSIRTDFGNGGYSRGWRGGMDFVGDPLVISI